MALSEAKNRKRCILLRGPVYIRQSGCVTGPKEGNGSHFADGFDRVWEDDFGGEKNWEEAESALLKQAVEITLAKAGFGTGDVDCAFAGDLLSQSTATSYGLSGLGIPHYGIFGACSGSGEALALCSMLIDGGYIERGLAVASSHFASAEREFRFPLGYGSQRPLSASWTVTGSGAFLLDRDEAGTALAKVTGVVMGEIVDPGITDAMNMGGCMAPAAALTITSALKEFPWLLESYDQIITGDLGEVGSLALADLMRQQGYDIGERHMDCGLCIYDREKEDVHAGGSGCGCSAVMLAAFVLPKLKSGDWRRVLFVPTGALLSKVRTQEKMSVPSIAHGVVIERV
ncbi:MAG: stage V sporulation protein AD [Lachnospiraceae bacterium]|nr:stage V sporulation protein AD [Lachnospiraceae bacterium]